MSSLLDVAPVVPVVVLKDETQAVPLAVKLSAPLVVPPDVLIGSTSP